MEVKKLVNVTNLMFYEIPIQMQCLPKNVIFVEIFLPKYQNIVFFINPL